MAPKKPSIFLFFFPQSVYNLLGETLSRLQQYAEAERWFQASLASQPDHVPAHITYGKLLARNVSSRRFAFRSPSPAIAALFHLIAIYFPSLTISAVTTCETSAAIRNIMRGINIFGSIRSPRSSRL